MTSGTLHVEHMRMEMAKILQEVDRLGGTRAGMEGEGHLVSQSAIGIAFRAAKRSFDIAASVVDMVRPHILSRIPEMHLAKPTFGTVGA
ncbi:hypothetical protein [uncultured Ellagibacter sp.]|uniref:hypothetical protein n=1 Tax=uncultured Ellagibacter sp. TaxID=2137580 RepID=UPI00263424F9|nr:hypothetical protein [uncultured Ellagibacter sp.]